MSSAHVFCCSFVLFWSVGGCAGAGVSTDVKQMTTIRAAYHSNMTFSETVQIHWDAAASGCYSDRLGSLWLGHPWAELKPSSLAPY